jgi:hypothetical protein
VPWSLTLLFAFGREILQGGKESGIRTHLGYWLPLPAGTVSEVTVGRRRVMATRLVWLQR